MNPKTKVNLLIIAVTSIGLALSSLSAWSIYNTERKAINTEFKKDVDARAISIYRELDRNFEVLSSLAILFRADTTEEYTTFHKEANKIKLRHKEIKFLQWLTFDNLSQQLDSFSNKISCFRGYEINKKHNILQFLKKTRELPFSQIGSIIILNNAQSKQKSIFSFLPIYRGDPHTLKECRDNFIGFIVCAYSVNTIFKSSALGNIAIGIDMKLLDTTNPENIQTIYNHKSRTGFKTDNSIKYAQTLKTIWGKEFTLSATPTTIYISQRQSKHAQTIFIFGVLFTFLIVIYIKIISQRTIIIEQKVIAKTKELKIANSKLEQISRIDPLTGIANRRNMDEFLMKEWSHSIRTNSYISFIIVDIDFFKLYNDNYGHLMGDDCLKKVAAALETTISRSSDLVARYGGEEFAIILGETSDAYIIADKCRKAVESLQIKHQHSSVSNVITISVGACSYTPTKEGNPTIIIEAADKKLYQAKESGRNKVESIIFERHFS